MGHAVPLRLAVVAVFGALALAGCGRRGPLELPQSATPTPAAADEELSRQNLVLQTDNQPGLIQSPNKIYQKPSTAKLNAEVAHPKRPINAPPVDKPSTFALDPLL